MSTKQVLIISPNELFREGLQRILKLVPDLSLAGADASLAEAEQLIREKAVDIILIEQNGNHANDAEEISQLLGLPGENLQVIALSLENMQMQNYQRQQIPSATMQSFMKAIEGG